MTKANKSTEVSAQKDNTVVDAVGTLEDRDIWDALLAGEDSQAMMGEMVEAAKKADAGGNVERMD